jgi:hypothetical protein
MPITSRLWWLLAGCSFVVISVGIGTVHAARWQGSDQPVLLKLLMIALFVPVPLFPAGYCFSRFAKLPGPAPDEHFAPWEDAGEALIYEPQRLHW